ncbi:MAG: hypothetical protein IKU37_10510 [Candidatus Gastranaerophilales bacterium]|nr:hypothetical protein [Candidatus Gastranaerophilales bacterium]
MDNTKKTSYETSKLQNINLEICHDDIIENLKQDSEDFIKIFSIINLEKFKNLEEVELLFTHLTNQPTPIREAVALKLEEIYKDELYSAFIKEQLLKAIIDINPNVCRAICNIIFKSEFLKNNLLDDLIIRINNLLVEIKKQDRNLGGFYDDAQKIRKNHAKNKKLFSLYWYLEVLSICIKGKNNSQVLEIIKETIKFNDYTIREKTAKILININDSPIELLKIIQNDQNFYVKNLVYDRINFED